MLDTRVLFELTAAFDAAACEIDGRTLRAAFAELVDRALPQLGAARLDLDDVLLEHACCLYDTSDDPPREFDVVLASLVDHRQWFQAFDDARQSAGLGPCDQTSTRIRSLRLRVHRETAIPLPDFRVPQQLGAGATHAGPPGAA